MAESNLMEVKGYDFNEGVNYEGIVKSLRTSGTQATNLYRAIEIVNKMLENKFGESNDGCTIFFAMTSNMISCGLREILRWIAEKKMVDSFTTTTGAIEEDVTKVFDNTYVAKFELDGKKLHQQGLARIGNMLTTNDVYFPFYDLMQKVLRQANKEQKEQKKIFSPSDLNHRMGLAIENNMSFYHWTSRNNIPVFAPAYTDGAVGDAVFFHRYRDPGLIIDVVGDVRKIVDMAKSSKKIGLICLGGGIPKNHVCDAARLAGGADFAVFINTGHAFDDSSSGATLEQEIHNGAIKKDAEIVKVTCECSLVFPILCQQTFAKYDLMNKKKKKV